MFKGIGIVLQGPTKYVDQILECYSDIENVVWSTWSDEPEEYLEKIRSSTVRLVLSEKPVITGVHNVNLQCVSTYNGIKALEPSLFYAIKIRSDMTIRNVPLFLKETEYVLKEQNIAFIGHLKKPTFYFMDYIVAGTIAEMLSYWEPELEDASGHPYPEYWLQERYFNKSEHTSLYNYLKAGKARYIHFDLNQNDILFLKMGYSIIDSQLQSLLIFRGCGYYVNVTPKKENKLKIAYVDPSWTESKAIALIQSSMVAMEEDWCLWLVEGETIDDEILTSIQNDLNNPDDVVYRIGVVHDDVPDHLILRYEPRLIKKGVPLERVPYVSRRSLPVTLIGKHSLFVPQWLNTVRELYKREDFPSMGQVLVNQYTQHFKQENSMYYKGVLLKWIVLLMLETKETDETLSFVENLCDQYQYPDFHYLRGRVLLMKERYEEAYEAFSQGTINAINKEYILESFNEVEMMCQQYIDAML